MSRDVINVLGQYLRSTKKCISFDYLLVIEKNDDDDKYYVYTKSIGKTDDYMARQTLKNNISMKYTVIKVITGLHIEYFAIKRADWRNKIPRICTLDMLYASWLPAEYVIHY